MDSGFDMAININQKLNLRDTSIALKPEEKEEDEDGNYEFSFTCAEKPSSPISAADLFHNGQIRPISPLFVQGAASLLDDLVERSDLPFVSEAEEVDANASHCAGTKPAPVPRSCRKSNSTGFSKLWRFRDMLTRSQSDGKETFVFLTDNAIDKGETTSSSKKKKKKEEKNSRLGNGKKGGTAAESKTTSSNAKTTTTSSYAMQYGKNGEKGKEKRRSYLPYRQDLVGFFTNANAVSRNIHPY